MISQENLYFLIATNQLNYEQEMVNRYRSCRRARCNHLSRHKYGFI